MLDQDNRLLCELIQYFTNISNIATAVTSEGYIRRFSYKQKVKN